MHFGTFNASRAPCSTALAGLRLLADNDSAGFKKLRSIGEELTSELKTLFKSQDQHDVICQGEGPLLQVFFTDRPSIDDMRAYCQSVDSDKYNRFANLLREEGVYITPTNTLHSASSFAHTSADVSDTVQAFARTLKRLH